MNKIILIAISLFFLNQKAHSCDCTQYSTDSLYRLSYEVADIVFLGELMSSDYSSSSYEFRIFETFKGEENLETIAGKAYSSCSITPSTKGMWLIYANYTHDGFIDINVCYASKSFSSPGLFHPPQPKSENTGDGLTFEVQQLKSELEQEKINRKMLVGLLTELERLRHVKRKTMQDE